MTPLRAAIAVATSALLALVMLGATAAPLPWHPQDLGMLRLSWRARPERVEVCREPTAEELAGVAEHMRQALLCEGSSASYLLRVAVDDRLLDSAVVRGGGLRHDRLLQLLRNYPLAAGPRRIVISLERREAVDSISVRLRGEQAVLPPRLRLDTVVTIAPGRVAMVTLESATRTLTLRQHKE